MDFPGSSDGKASAYSAGDLGDSVNLMKMALVHMGPLDQ